MEVFDEVLEFLGLDVVSVDAWYDVTLLELLILCLRSSNNLLTLLLAQPNLSSSLHFLFKFYESELHPLFVSQLDP